jgi:hypothetical protein
MQTFDHAPAGPRPSRRRHRWLVSAALVLALLASVGLALLHFGPAQRSEAPPSAEELRRHWQGSLRWMRTHEALVLADGNPMLWRMVRDAAALSGDPWLADMLQRYRQRFFSRQPPDAWVLLVDPDATPGSNHPAGLQALPAYMKLMAYGMTCDAGLGETEIVRKQMVPGWCSAITARRVLLQHKCVTHQMAGYLLMQERRCKDPAHRDAMTRLLQDRIVDELSIDFVMRDEHLQRVLMLYWTGAPERVKPVWLNRVLRAQRPDGGWDYEAEFTRRLAGRDAVPSFHATAQGLLILAMALRQAESAGP